MKRSSTSMASPTAINELSEVKRHTQVNGVREDVGLQIVAAVDRHVHAGVISLVLDEGRPAVGDAKIHTGLGLERHAAELVIEGRTLGARDFDMRDVDADAGADIRRPALAFDREAIERVGRQKVQAIGEFEMRPAGCRQRLLVSIDLIVCLLYTSTLPTNREV